MKNVYLILGNGKLGKSTLVRHLTGIREASIVEISRSNNVSISLWAWMRSAQEMPKSPMEILALIDHQDKVSCTDILLPLRILPANNQPGYLEYVNAIVNAGHSIVQSIVLTDQASISTQFQIINPFVVPNTVHRPSNSVASQVRALWGWT
jgi:hypothetical protein